MKNNASKQNRRSQKWSLMFIGSDGTLRQVKGFKFLLTLGVFLLTASVMTAGAFYVLYDRQLKDNKRIESDLSRLQKQIKMIESRNELLRARLVVYDPENGKSLMHVDDSETAGDEPVPEDNVQPDAAGESQTGTSGDENGDLSGDGDTDENIADADESPENDGPNAAETAEPVTEEIVQTAHLVDAEEFTVSQGRTSRELNIKMKIVNTSSDRISGHVIIVLKSAGSSEAEWKAFPSVKMIDGKPTGDETGKTFSISRFKTMFFKAKPVDSIEQVNAATVFVFTKTGDLLLEKTFPVSLN